jgi:hypothetical protein
LLLVVLLSLAMLMGCPGLEEESKGTHKNEILDEKGQPDDWITRDKNTGEELVTLWAAEKAAAQPQPPNEIWIWEYDDGSRYIIENGMVRENE